MTVRTDGGACLQHVAPRRPRRRARQVLFGTGFVAVLSVICTACGGSGASDTLKLSVSSGPPGTVVTVSGDAGSGCVVQKNWYGFDFQPSGQLNKGPATQMTTPVAPKGTWTAIFVIPSYLGGSSARGPGAPTTPGHYEFTAPSCNGKVLAKGSFQVTSTAPPTKEAKDYVGIVSTVDGQGYWVVQADGSVTAYGDAKSEGSLSSSEAASTRIVGMARTYSGNGYWLVSSTGHVFTFGDAKEYGSVSPTQSSSAPIVGIAASPDGKGYWLASASGQVFGFGDAHLEGMPNSNYAPFDAIGARPAGGYVVTAASNAATYVYPALTGGPSGGGGPGTALSGMLVGTAVTPSGNGTWQAGTDGGVITTGDAVFHGSVPSVNGTLTAPVTGIAGSPDGLGYWLVCANGDVFSFGSAHYFGDPQHPPTT
jgi:hypothetical protein